MTSALCWICHDYVGMRVSTDCNSHWQQSLPSNSELVGMETREHFFYFYKCRGLNTRTVRPPHYLHSNKHNCSAPSVELIELHTRMGGRTRTNSPSCHGHKIAAWEVPPLPVCVGIGFPPVVDPARETLSSRKRNDVLGENAPRLAPTWPGPRTKARAMHTGPLLFQHFAAESRRARNSGGELL